MSLHDLVESDCGGSNSLVKFSTHFVQDHAFKDQDLKQSGQPDNQGQSFLEASTGELADQFFSSEETESYKMDTLLAELRGAEGCSDQKEAWPTQFTKKTDKQDLLFDPNIWSSSENKMLVKDEVYDFGYNPEWVKEIEQSYQNQQNDATKSRFDFNKNNENGIQFNTNNTESPICDDLIESYKKMSVENIVGLPMNNFEPELQRFLTREEDMIGLRRFIQYQDPGVDDFLLNQQLDPELETRTVPISVIGQPVSSSTVASEQEAQINEFDGNVEAETEQSRFRNWFSEFQTLKKDELKKEYSFTPENDMESIENPLAEGKRRLEIGELPTAVLCFEAAAKQDPSNAEAWQLLGTTQAENEQDQFAINALNKCLELQPENLTAVLCLAACYTNEGYNLEACRMLMEWLNQNPKYCDIVKSKPIPEDSHMNYLFTSKLYETVKVMYIEAAQRSLEVGEIDADVQNGLGVLLNLNNENDKAVDCFKAALQIRPNDARLWNRLGATLANGQKCEEAIEAYYNALQLCPGFVRARYNLGITCIHLNTYREATEHLLEALNQQASAVSANSQSPVLSDSIWSTLRLAISLEERSELLKAVNDRNLDLLNEEFGYHRPDRNNDNEN